jgi:shikimate dehydrogenase
MLETLSGVTRLYGLLDHPISQVMSPAGVTRAFESRGRNAVLVPIHIEPAAVDALIDALGPVHNLDGISATMPHKFSAYRHANTSSDRAHRLTVANILRRNAVGAGTAICSMVSPWSARSATLGVSPQADAHCW